MLQFSASDSTNPNWQEAVAELLEELNRSTKHDRAALVCLFVSLPFVEKLPEIAERITKALSPIHMLAAGASGIIAQNQEVEQGPGMSLLVTWSDELIARPFTYDQLNWAGVIDQPEAVRHHTAPRRGQPRAILLIADPFSAPTSSMLPALSNAWPDVPIIGGAASAGRRPRENRLYLSGQTYNQGAVGLVLSGPFEVQTTVSQGCRPVGKPHRITRCQRHIVQELDDAPALEVVRDTIAQLDPHDESLARNASLLIGRAVTNDKPRFGRGDFLIRQIVNADEEQGSFAVADPQIEQGQIIQFHVRDRQTAMEDYELLLEMQQLHGPAAGALLINCVGRGQSLFGQPDVDITTTQRALGNAPLAGFFAAGEFGLMHGQNFLHGHTASLAAFRNVEG